MSKLAICQVTYRDHGAGAEQVALGLHRAYRAAGHDAWLVVGGKRDDGEGVIELDNDRSRNPWSRVWGAASRKIGGPDALRRAAKAIARPTKYVRRALGHEDFHQPATARLLDDLPKTPDVVHAHTLHGDYFDLRELPAIARRVPTVITLHDMWMMTGGCFYPLDCERWKTGCGTCPYLHLTPWIHRDRTAENRDEKAAIYRDAKVHVAAPSKWMLDQVDESILAPAVVDKRHIPNAVDTDIFSPGDRDRARAAVGLQKDALVLLFAGRSLRHHPFKDYATVRRAAGKATAQCDRTVVLLVAGEDYITSRDGTLIVRFMGNLDRERMVEAYRAADVYIHAAKAENHPMAILEAMACGTPVVATAVGGVAEQLSDGENGFIVDPGDDETMALRIALLAADESLRETMSHAAVATAQRYGLADQAAAYLDWFTGMTAAKV